MYKSVFDRLVEHFSFHGDKRIIEDFIRSIEEDLEWKASKTLEFLQLPKSGKTNALEISRVFRGDKGLEELKTAIYAENRKHNFFLRRCR
jgi:hypothetical protein